MVPLKTAAAPPHDGRGKQLATRVGIGWILASERASDGTSGGADCGSVAIKIDGWTNGTPPAGGRQEAGVNPATLWCWQEKRREQCKIRVERANKELGSTADRRKGARKCNATVLAHTNIDANTVRGNGIGGRILQACCHFFNY